VRVIAATNRDLLERCREGAFREDLYYRVNVVRVELPPLRSRKEDVPLLVEQFVERFNAHQKKCVSGIAPEALSLLMAHNWPGNVRELENVIERAFILCGDGRIELGHLLATFSGKCALSAVAAVSGLKDARAALDAQAIRSALERHNGNRTAAAQALGVHKTTLFKKIRMLGIDVPWRKVRK